MLRRLLTAAVLLPVGVLLAQGYAQAQTAYTPASLSALLLTPSEVATVVKIAGSAQTFTESDDVEPSSDPIGVARVFAAEDGSFISVSLFSLVDGSPPPARVRDSVLNGELLRSVVAGSLFDSVSGFELGPSLLGDDIAALFTGEVDGTNYKVVADSFVRGNVFGYVLYASAGDADALIVGALLGGQTAKLP